MISAAADSVLPHLLKHLNIGTFLLYSWSFSRLWKSFWLGCCCHFAFDYMWKWKTVQPPRVLPQCSVDSLSSEFFYVEMRKMRCDRPGGADCSFNVCVCVRASTGLCSGPGAHWGWSRHQGNAEAAGEYLLRVVFVFWFVMVHHPIHKPAEWGQSTGHPAGAGRTSTWKGCLCISCCRLRKLHCATTFVIFEVAAYLTLYRKWSWRPL